jgi:hypothetical protein
MLYFIAFSRNEYKGNLFISLVFSFGIPFRGAFSNEFLDF